MKIYCSARFTCRVKFQVKINADTCEHQMAPIVDRADERKKNQRRRRQKNNEQAI